MPTDLTPTQRLHAALAAQQAPTIAAIQRSRGPEQQEPPAATDAPEPLRHRFARPQLTPKQLAKAIRAHTSPPVSPEQLAGELHVLRLQHKAMGREIAQREAALDS